MAPYNDALLIGMSLQYIYRVCILKQHNCPMYIKN